MQSQTSLKSGQVTHETPKQAGFCQPAEWEQHAAVWLAWPSHAELWQENLPGAQAEFMAFCKAIADLDPATKKPRGEKLNILVPTLVAKADAEAALQGLPVTFFLIPFGDIWLRDTAPIFLKKDSEIATAQFQFNSWGGKYNLPDDDLVAERIAKSFNQRHFDLSWVLEGGSVEVDGEGTCLTSKECLLNENRNPHLSQSEIENKLSESLGVEKILWLDRGLLNDHTDGHIDTIARFTAPGKVLCMKATTADDPNHEIFESIAQDLANMVDAQGRKMTVGHVPSPGAVLNADGDLMPASYLNFYIGNTTVIVPTYGSPQDEAAVLAIASWFPHHKTVGLSAKSILTGGGAFHCISQQQPI